MLPSFPRVLAGFVLGALAGILALTVAFARNPGVTLDMYRDLPRGNVSGFYPAERDGDRAYAWTGRSAAVRFNGLRRTAPWDCTIRYRGGRADIATLPDVEVAIDGLAVARQTATNEYQDLLVSAGPGTRASGLTLTITSSNTFTPGPGDPRELGIQVSRLDCRPAEGRLVLPPAAALWNAALASALLAATLAWAGLPMLWTLLLGLLVVLGQATLLSTGFAPYGPYGARFGWYAAAVSIVSVGLLATLGRGLRPPQLAGGFALSAAARFVVLLSGLVFYLKVLGLLHPGKLIIDAVFHAHRLGWVLDGRLFFTQPLPNGVSFPYAIGLYVFAAPWTFLTSDYVTLLRTVVCLTEATAGALLYFLVVRLWGDRLVGVLAVVFFHAVPMAYGILGNANLTNVFGQAVAVMAVVAAATLVPGRARVAGLLALCSLAFLAHISTFAVLLVTLAALAGGFWFSGAPDRRQAASRILGIAAIAATLAVVAYYGHFGDVYATALRARSEASAPADPERQVEPRPSQAATAVAARLGRSAQLTIVELGWPLIVLGGAGLVRVWVSGAHGRGAALLIAYGVAYVVFFGAGVTTRVDPALERYATEFVGRVNLATYPALALLAAHGAAWGWRSGLGGQLAVATLTAFALHLAVSQWRGWIG